MKYFFIISFLILNHLTNAQPITTIQWKVGKISKSHDTIYYNPAVKLTWSDFRGKPDANSIAAAITSSGFGYSMDMHSKNGVSYLDISVNCYFIKPRSWVKPKMNSAYALLHEQHHFDITYINASFFVKKLKEAHFTNANYKSLLDKIYRECYSNMQKMQTDYDKETKNGQLPDVQASWNKKIDAQLITVATDAQ